MLFCSRFSLFTRYTYTAALLYVVIINIIIVVIIISLLYTTRACERGQKIQH